MYADGRLDIGDLLVLHVGFSLLRRKSVLVVTIFVLFYQTLNLLFKMTNSLNVVVIADKLIAYLKTTRDEYIKADLVSKITQLAERYPLPSLLRTLHTNQTWGQVHLKVLK